VSRDFGLTGICTGVDGVVGRVMVVVVLGGLNEGDLDVASMNLEGIVGMLMSLSVSNLSLAA